MDAQPPPWTIEFYTTARGDRVVESDIDSLRDAREQAKIYDCLRLLREFGTQLGMPHACPLSGHRPLWELRPTPHRLIYFAHTGRRFIVLHVFRKTAMRMQRKHIETAKRRMGEFLEREK